MILIFGGAYQGKFDYAVERFNLTGDEIYRCSRYSVVMPMGRKLVYELDKWIFALLEADDNADGAVKQFIENNKGAIVICNDISCGVVPIDPLERAWREAVGRAMAAMAREADEVVRIFCGIATVIKG